MRLRQTEILIFVRSVEFVLPLICLALSAELVSLHIELYCYEALFKIFLRSLDAFPAYMLYVGRRLSEAALEEVSRRMWGASTQVSKVVAVPALITASTADLPTELPAQALLLVWVALFGTGWLLSLTKVRS